MTLELPAPRHRKVERVLADPLRNPNWMGPTQSAEQSFRSEDVQELDPVLGEDVLDPQTELAAIAPQELRAATSSSGTCGTL